MNYIYLREHKGPRVLQQAFKFIRTQIFLSDNEQYITIKFFLKENTVEDSSNLDGFSTNGSNVQCYISYGNLYETVTIRSFQPWCYPLPGGPEKITHKESSAVW